MSETAESYSSTERMSRLLSGQPVDRVPVFTFILGFAARHTSCTIHDIYARPEKSFNAQLRTQKHFGYDSTPFYGYASYGAWEFGGTVEFPSGEYEQAPYITGRLPVESEDDVTDLRPPNVETAGALPRAMEFSKLQQRHGLPVSVVVGGSFTVALNICDEGKLLRWMIRKPELVHRILRVTTDHLKEVMQLWTTTFGVESFIPQIWEPTASNQVISQKLFGELVLPYQRELHRYILDLGVKHIFCHICGEQNNNLPFWAEVPMGDPGIVSFGNEVDLTTAVQAFGDTCIIAGNIQPSVIQTGKPEQIYGLCAEAIDRAKHAPRGFILMPGCEFPVDSPPENLQSMMNAALGPGRYDP